MDERWEGAFRPGRFADSVIRTRTSKKHKIERNQNRNPNRQMNPQQQQQSKNPDVSDICIPRMEKNVRREFIFNILRKMKIGYIERISEIPLKKEATHKRVIIKIKWKIY